MKLTYKLFLFVFFSLFCILSIILISLENTSNLNKKDKFNLILSHTSEASQNYTLFLKTKNIKLIENYNFQLNKASELNSEIDDITLRNRINSKIESIKIHTNDIVKLWKLRGLNENSGFEGNFRENVHNLEDLLEKTNLYSLKLSMLQARRSEKDFILRRKSEYVDKVLSMITKIRNDVLYVNKSKIDKDSVNLLTNRYLDSFSKLVHILESIDEKNLKLNRLESDLKLNLQSTIKEIDIVNADFSKTMYIAYVLLFICLIFISIVMIYGILNPIDSMIITAKNIAKGSYNLRVNYNKKDELGEFASAFNIMVNKFILSKNNLELLNNKLDIKVKERTKELENEVQMRKISEIKLEKYNNEVNRLLDKERQLGELKTKFVATVSHEYRTPLTVILNSTYLISQYLKNNDIDSINNYLNKIQFSVTQMKDLLEDTLNYGEIESGSLKINKTQFNIEKLIKNLIQDFQTINKGRELIFFNIDSIDNIFSDKKAILHCLNNLIGNALKFSKEIVEVTLSKTEFDIVISVKDKGIGIPENEIDNVFSAFYRSDNAKNYSGTGLGLSITKKYINSIGGIINIYSKENEGTEFLIRIPYQSENLLIITNN